MTGAPERSRSEWPSSVADFDRAPQWVEFEHAGHFPELEEPRRFRDLMLRFLAS